MRSPGIVLFGTKNLPNKTHAAGAKQVPSLSQPYVPWGTPDQQVRDKTNKGDPRLVIEGE